MITITKPTYKCEHCSKLYQRKRFAVAHEISCKKNPLNIRKCFDCKHCKFILETLYEDTFQGESKREVGTFFCSAKDHYLHPPKAEHKGNAYEFGEKTNEPMPMECDKFKSTTISEYLEKVHEKTLSEYQEKTQGLTIQYSDDPRED